MSEDSQLLSLMKACEAKEQEIVRQMAEVEKILSLRMQALSIQENHLKKINEKLYNLNHADRFRAIKEKNSAQLSSIDSYSRQLREEVSSTLALLLEKQKEVVNAQKRMSIVEEELLGVRVEKRKVEKLLAGRNLEAIAQDAAIEELNSDEVSQVAYSKRS